MRTRLQAVRVQEVILNNETNPERYDSLGGHDAVGAILFTKLNDTRPIDDTTDKMSFALPLFAGITQYPLVGEIVYLVRGPGAKYDDGGDTIKYYIPAIKIQGHPNHNALPDVVYSDKEALSDEEIEGGATSANLEDEEISINFGEYFKEIEKIRPLRPYEGDTIIEGRFGNTIRLGSTTSNKISDYNRWSNEGEIGNPITIIRNGQHKDELKESFEHILEDIDNDDSSIYLCSDQQLSYFVPASLYQVSYGGDNIELITPIEPEITDEPLNEETKEDTIVSPVELEEEEEEIIEEEEEEIADYDDAITEEQAILPGEDLGDLPYANPEGIDIEKQMGPPLPPPLHADAEESMIITAQQQWNSQDFVTEENSPYGFYNSRAGSSNPFKSIIVKDKNMTTIHEGNESTASLTELIQEAKNAIGIY